MMPFFSRHWKKVSRPSQHCALAVRSGAMYPPSCEGSGAAKAGWGVSVLVLNQPIYFLVVDVALRVEGVGVEGVMFGSVLWSSLVWSGCGFNDCKT